MPLIRPIFIHSVCAMVAIAMLHSCSIEKRHYMSGYHVEIFSRKSHAPLIRNEKNEDLLQIASETIHDSIAVIDPTISEPAAASALVETIPSEENRFSPVNPRAKTAEVAAYPGINEASEKTENPSAIAAQIHPAAAGSLLFGILSALCFVGLFVSSFHPLALVIALIAGLFLFAILAKILSRRAFDDMYHARNRYSGRGLAAAGLALSVITIVAFLGLLAVLVFGIGFTTLV